VVAGSSVTLSWSASNATTCTASGGNWTGTKAVTSSTEAVVVDATVTYTLSCTGPGGTSSQTAMVTATPKPSGGKSGGGALDPWVLALLGGLLAARIRRMPHKPASFE
jgi:hypothetical protein